MIKISYAIPVCNEHIEIQRLLTFLLKHKRHQDEIIILFDSKNGTPTVKNYLHSKSVNNDFIWFPYEFDGHFANMKNKLTTQCIGDYIFQIDADEIPNEILIENLPAILSDNPDNEVYYVPRVNTVSGLTPGHIKKWNWNVDAEGRVNYPDYQMRIYKNNGEIKWRNKVHEVLENHKTFSSLPAMEELSLYHPKDIKRQEKQNSYYNTL